MPGCVLRVAGAEFDPDAFLATTSLVPHDVYRKGEPRGRSGKTREKSGLTVLVSDAGGNDFRRQSQDALNFLEKNGTAISRLHSQPGVEHLTLDFGVYATHDFVKSYSLPAALIRLAGNLGLEVELTIYVSSPE